MNGYYLAETIWKKDEKPTTLTDAYYGTTVTQPPGYSIILKFKRKDSVDRSIALYLSEEFTLDDICKGANEMINTICTADI